MTGTINQFKVEGFKQDELLEVVATVRAVIPSYRQAIIETWNPIRAEETHTWSRLECVV
jgi:hypothetical protein